MTDLHETAPSPSRQAPLPPGIPRRVPAIALTVLLSRFQHLLMPLLHRRYGDLFHMRVFPEGDVVQMCDIEQIKQVFSGPASVFHAGEGNIALKPIMGEHSVLVTDEDVHLRARKLLMPAFNGAALRGYRTMMTDVAEAEADTWRAGRPFSAHDRMRALTFEIILRVVFGVSEGPRLDELRALLLSVTQIGTLQVLAWQSPRLYRFGPWRALAEKEQRSNELLLDEIRERRTAPDLAARTDVLSKLLTVPADGSPMSDQELRDQLITLLLAGHETTATALAWAFHELAHDPARLDRATAAADTGDDAYLEAVVKEAMRLRPVVSEVGRKLTEPVEIGGYRIPAGWTVMPSIQLVHQDSRHYDDPGEFRPERFLGADAPASGAWFPFGGGVRRCLGAGFSLIEATVVLRVILSRFTITPDRPRRESARPHTIGVVPARGSRIVVRPR
ncbi:cytochrome P450 [Actinoplanes missouriensis]